MRQTKAPFLITGPTSIRIDLKILRKSIAIAPQKSMLFSGSVYDNIALGNPDATEQEIFHAAETAQADSFIREMPDGYHSILGQGGVNISGGQKQRISIARALVRDSFDFDSGRLHECA